MKRGDIGRKKAAGGYDYGRKKAAGEYVKCSTPECANDGVFPVEDGKRLCQPCIHERVNSPGCLAATEADSAMQDFIEGGGKLS